MSLFANKPAIFGLCNCSVKVMLSNRFTKNFIIVSGWFRFGKDRKNVNH